MQIGFTLNPIYLLSNWTPLQLHQTSAIAHPNKSVSPDNLRINNNKLYLRGRVLTIHHYGISWSILKDI